MNSQINLTDVATHSSKRGPGPRGIRKQRQQQENSIVKNKRMETGNKSQTNEISHERLSFKDLLFERNNLKKYEHSPKVDLWEEKDENESYYMIRMELPGINTHKINIDIKDNQYILVTAFKSGDKPSIESVIYSECKYGKVTRRVKVPNLIYNENARFKYEDGILKIETRRIKNLDTQKEEENLSLSTHNISLDSRLDDNISGQVHLTSRLDDNISAQVLYSTLTPETIPETTPETIVNWADEPV